MVVVLLAVSTLFTLTFGKSDAFISSLFVNSKVDYSNLGWSEAFDQMNTCLAQNYAFGNWKGINWNALHTEFEPQIAAAEQDGDKKAYYLALREYVFSLPDGHVKLIGDEIGLRKAAIGGGYGFAAAQLDDGRIIAHIILSNGPAEQAGMVWGAEILTWNNQSILSALVQVSTLWSGSPVATREEINFRKLNLLTRGPVGHQITVTFRNPCETTIRQTTLIASDDQMALFKRSLVIGTQTSPLDLFIKPVESQILPNGYGYLKINIEIPTFGGFNPVGMVRDAVAEFNDADVPGVVIDVRSNAGGSDVMAAEMMAYFASEPMIYEQIAHMDKVGKLKVIGEIILKPASLTYTGPVSMLIDNNTVSTGEGFPLIMKSLKRGPVVGFCGTDGSMGMTGSSIKLPGGYTVEYPNGASLDANGIIQCDSDSTLQGGILPDLRVPITEETLKEIYVEDRDIVLETAITFMVETDEKDRL
ncbi:S41 family peptidase [Bacteroidota bacterium]